mmetsp:Transcript_37054/g.90389  ORF Transcript_37054/g.90389 Transcript_37054/m.90389 type:complete len:144 (+) Transcript_37054:194-625(+)
MGYSDEPVLASQLPNRQAVDAWMMERRGGMQLNSCWVSYLQELFENLEWSAWDIPTAALEGAELEERREIWFGIFRACKVMRSRDTGEVTSDIMLAKCVAWALSPTQNPLVLDATKKMPAGQNFKVRRPGRVTCAIEEKDRYF